MYFNFFSTEENHRDENERRVQNSLSDSLLGAGWTNKLISEKLVRAKARSQWETRELSSRMDNNKSVNVEFEDVKPKQTVRFYQNI